MQNLWLVILSLLLAYLIGALPFGWMITWQVKRIDIRYHASGRMGMSNVIRTAGLPWGIATAALDIAKGFCAVWVVRLICPDYQPWTLAAAGALAILGHNYSIFIIERRRDNRLYFRGGAGGLTSLGAAIGIWSPILIYVPLPCLLIYLFSGYASITTLSFNLVAGIVFAVFAAKGQSSWWFVAYALVALILVSISLRPNFKRLRRGEERKSSLRIRWRKEDRNQPK